MKTVTFTKEQLTTAIMEAALDRADEFSKEENDDGSKFMLLIMLAGTAIAKSVAEKFFTEEETDDFKN